MVWKLLYERERVSRTIVSEVQLFVLIVRHNSMEKRELS